MATDQTIDGVWHAIDVVCDTPTLLLLEAIWLGDHRFSEFEASTGLQKALISSRLKSLIAEGVLHKRVLDGQERAQGYFLTSMGLGLFPAALLMLTWELQWNRKAQSPNIKVVHTKCGHDLGAIVTCHHCGDEVTPASITALQGPDFYVGENAFVKRRRQAGLDRTTIKLFDEIADILGDRWMALILRMALMGVKRFDAFENTIGISSNILSDRLSRAIDLDLMVRRDYQDNPPRQDYLLTDKAKDLQPIILFLMQWGADWFGKGTGKHIYLTHSCGADLRPEIRCAHCRDLVKIADTKIARQSD